MLETAFLKPLTPVTTPGSFSWPNPITESASWKYVLRAWTKATFLPSALPRA